MSLIRMTAKHGMTLEEARAQLRAAVEEIRVRFGSVLQRTAWAPDHNGVKLSGPGVEVEIRVDEHEVHVAGDVPLLGGILGRSLTSGMRNILQRKFQQRLV